MHWVSEEKALLLSYRSSKRKRNDQVETLKPTKVTSWRDIDGWTGEKIGSGAEGEVYALGNDKVLKVYNWDTFFNVDGDSTYMDEITATAKLAKFLHENDIGPELPTPFWYVRDVSDDDEDCEGPYEYAIRMKRYDKTANDVLKYHSQESDFEHLEKSVRWLLERQLSLGLVNLDSRPDNFFYDIKNNKYVIGDISALFTCSIEPNHPFLKYCGDSESKETLLGASLSFFNFHCKLNNLPSLFRNEAKTYLPIKELPLYADLGLLHLNL